MAAIVLPSHLGWHRSAPRNTSMSATDRSNEGKACDAVLRHIEAREGGARRDVIFPEKTHDIGPVELVCTVGMRRFAFEHTRIEPFAGHIQLEAEAARHFTPIQIEGPNTDRPDEVYLLSVLTSMWLITCLRRGDTTFYDMPVDDRFWETDAASLVNVTGERRAPKAVATP
jgi:hypothetical protein